LQWLGEHEVLVAAQVADVEVKFGARPVRMPTPTQDPKPERGHGIDRQVDVGRPHSAGEDAGIILAEPYDESHRASGQCTTRQCRGTGSRTCRVRVEPHLGWETPSVHGGQYWRR